MSAARRIALAWAPAAAYMTLIWVLSSMRLPIAFEDVPFRDKGVHFVEYGTLAVLYSLALARSGVRGGNSSRFALA